MAAKGNGSSAYLASTGTLTPLVSAYSWSFWYYPLASAASGGVTKHAFSATNSTGGTPGGYDINFAWDHNNPLAYKSAIHREAGGTYIFAQHPGTPASGSWYHVAATYNGTTLKLYYDGVNVASVAAAQPSGAMGNPEVTACAHDAAGGFDDAYIGELTIWNTTLTPAEVTSLKQGVAATSIQNGSIVSYSQLNTGAITQTGPALTNSGAALNVSYFLGSTGGLILGNNATSNQTTFSHTSSGGMVLGGNDSPIIFGVSFSTSVGVISAAGDAPYLRDSVGVASAFSLTSYRESVSSEVNVVSKFSPVIPGILASGRTLGNTPR